MAESFAERLKRLRVTKGFSQKELGNLAEVDYTHIGKYERGISNPSLDTLCLLSEAFDITIDYLVRGNEADAAIASLQDQELLKMFVDTENLPSDEKKAVKKLLNAFLASEKFKQQLAS